MVVALKFWGQVLVPVSFDGKNFHTGKFKLVGENSGEGITDGIRDAWGHAIYPPRLSKYFSNF